MDLNDYDKLTDDELIARINDARKARNAVILAHNYQPIEVQNIADFTGDSLELARKAAETGADVVVFCGVDFMAESAKILSPDKTVLLPVKEASCPMARMVSAEELTRAKAEHPDAVVVTYVNSTAAVKALSDICVTSSNAVKIVERIGDKPILFVPDRNLAAYTRSVTDADIAPWHGYCYVHNNFTVEDVEYARRRHPDAVLLVHPEAPPEVVERADLVASTSGMARYIAGLTDPDARRAGVILGTEIGLAARLRQDHPEVNIHPLTESAVCINMKRTSLATVCRALEENIHEITLPEDVIDGARAALERMLEVK